MSNDFNVNNLSKLFQEKVGNLKNSGGEDVKNINTEPTSVFGDGDVKKEDFVEKLYAGEKPDAGEAYTKDELGAIYDSVAALDGDNKMSKAENEFLASLGGDIKTIDKSDIRAVQTEIDVEKARIKAKMLVDAEYRGAEGATKEYVLGYNKEQDVKNAQDRAEAEVREKAKVLDEADKASIDETAAGVDEREKARAKAKEMEKQRAEAEAKARAEAEAKAKADAEKNKGNAGFKVNDKLKTDENGNKYVTVEHWTEKGTGNNSLSRIILNNYDLNAMGIKPESEAYKALEKTIMDANPKIYGKGKNDWRTEVGGTGRHNAVLYDNEKIILPPFKPQIK